MRSFNAGTGEGRVGAEVRPFGCPAAHRNMVQCWIDSENRVFLSYVLPELKRKYEVSIVKDEVLMLFDSYARVVILNINDGVADELLVFIGTEIKSYTQVLKCIHLLVGAGEAAADVVKVLRIGSKVMANFPDLYKPQKWPKRQLNMLIFREQLLDFLPAFDIDARTCVRGVLNRALSANT